MDRGNKLICPEDFGSMPVGWYINHSKNNFNAIHKNFNWFAFKDINKDEEILVDYNELNEPEESKEDYYKN